ncbi:MAG: DUF58 domain-containing protein, partial [Phyllobacteriaceae bacterium]|nr:DUF58 domain-containing protein [Phyllobacteriaceae bacterium]
ADRRAAERLAEALARATDDPFAAPAVAVAPHAEVVVIGDFLEDPAAIAERLAGFAGQGARVHALRIVDPGEAVPPWTGNVEFRDPETDERFAGRRAEALREGWSARFAAHGAELARLAARHGWSLVTHTTDRPAAEALLALHAGLGGARHGPRPHAGGRR